ncbi:unnamed protein product [Sympodiomycopsis kandeliae]
MVHLNPTTSLLLLSSLVGLTTSSPISSSLESRKKHHTSSKSSVSKDFPVVAKKKQLRNNALVKKCSKKSHTSLAAASTTTASKGNVVWVTVTTYVQPSGTTKASVASSAKVSPTTTATVKSSTAAKGTSTTKVTSASLKATSTGVKTTSTAAKATSTTAKVTSTTAKATSTTAKVTSTAAKVTSTSSAAKSTSTASLGTYKLTDSYAGSSFFDMWNFWAHDDPTHGTVAYQNRTSAMSSGLAYINSNNQAVLKVDSTNNYTLGTGRPSVRLHSKKAYKTGLAVLDVEHLPVGCSVWPAWWSNGANWPNGGEIDIIEGVGDSGINTVSIHTASGCTLNDAVGTSSNFTGNLLRTNCDAYNPPIGGCSTTSAKSSVSYGSGFNANKGGVYVSQFEPEGIKVWLFNRNSLPADLIAGNPDPSQNSWPTPQAYFSTDSCDYEKYFSDQTIIINTTLGGDWACGTYGQKWTSQATCPGTCTEQIMNGDNFKDAYWVINSMKVYQRS